MPFIWIWRDFHCSAPAQELRSLIESGEASILGPHQSLKASFSLSVTFTDIFSIPKGVDSNGMPILEGDK
jgi:hypothetical protein